MEEEILSPQRFCGKIHVKQMLTYIFSAHVGSSLSLGKVWPNSPFSGWSVLFLWTHPDFNSVSICNPIRAVLKTKKMIRFGCHSISYLQSPCIKNIPGEL